jgi:hypothetical protein
VELCYSCSTFTLYSELSCKWIQTTRLIKKKIVEKKIEYRINCLQIYEHLKLGDDYTYILVLNDSLALLLCTSNIFVEEFTEKNCDRK